MTYREPPDVGALVSAGINAMARGFAQIAEEAARRAQPPPKPKPLISDDLMRPLTRYLHESVVVKREISLQAHRSGLLDNITLIASFDGAYYQEEISHLALVIERHPIIPLRRAVDRIAERINREFR